MRRFDFEEHLIAKKEKTKYSTTKKKKKKTQYHGVAQNCSLQYLPWFFLFKNNLVQKKNMLCASLNKKKSFVLLICFFLRSCGLKKAFFYFLLYLTFF